MKTSHTIRRAARLGVVLAAIGVVVLLAGCSDPDGTPGTRGTPTGTEPVRPTDTAKPTGPTEIREPAAFIRIDGGTRPAVDLRAEVTDPAALNRYLTYLPDPETAADVRAQLAKRPPRSEPTRLFAFLLTGCLETSATLTIQPTGTGLDRLSARLTGGEEVLCDEPNQFVAFFAVPEGLLR